MSAGGSCSSGSSATIFLVEHGLFEPALQLRPDRPACRSATSSAPAASGTARRCSSSTGLCFAVILAVIAPSAVAARDRPRPARADPADAAPCARPRRWRSPASPRVAMAATGAYAYHNIKVLNRYQTSDEAEKFSADYERKYLKYEKLPQPTITKVDARRAAVPEGAAAAGRRPLRPQERRPTRRSATSTSARATATPSSSGSSSPARGSSRDDREFGYRIYRFDTPLAPGATASADLHLAHLAPRLPRRAARRPTSSRTAPSSTISTSRRSIGMNRQGLLSDRAKRRRQGLPPELRPAKLEDLSATARNYIGCRLGDCRTSPLTTDAGQTPIAPGSTRVGRDQRTAAAPRASSARRRSSTSSRSSRPTIEIATRNHNGVELSVYYHPGHDWNVPKMLERDGRVARLLPRQFRALSVRLRADHRIPRLCRASPRRSPAPCPIRRSIGFIADTSDPEKIDFTTYVIAHEIAHQYWAHQVIGADMQGGTLTSETLAQYSALMVMKRLYGPDKIRRFLKYELDTYLSNRKGEVVEELPLDRVENQPTSTTARARWRCICCRSGSARPRSTARWRGSSPSSASRARPTCARST